MKRVTQTLDRGVFSDWAIRQRKILSKLLAKRPFTMIRSKNVDRGVRKKPFTISELVILITIVAILGALILPTLIHIQGSAKLTQCRNNIQRLMLGFALFADDHDDHFPGGYPDVGKSGRDEWKGCWLFGGGNPDCVVTDGPEKGTIFSYTGDVRDYRCPSLEFVGMGVGNGSNGQFDYSAFAGFRGALISNIPTISEPIGGSGIALPTPILVEEDPSCNINSAGMEGSHSGKDRLARTHGGRAVYGAFDGAAELFKQPLNGEAKRWLAARRDGTLASPGEAGVPWGWWND